MGSRPEFGFLTSPEILRRLTRDKPAAMSEQRQGGLLCKGA
jgi:hypothetical protein